MSALRFPSLIAGAIVLLLGAAAWSQKPQIKPGQRYLLLATTRTSTMQKELNEAAAQGFRVVAGSASSGSEMVIVMERAAPPSDAPRYKVLATTETSTMERELNDAAGEGYRLLPTTLMAKRGALSTEIVAVMESEPRSAAKHQYRLLATVRTSTLQKEITRAGGEGFTLAGMVSRGEHIVILAKP